jgi:hypothetical protein
MNFSRVKLNQLFLSVCILLFVVVLYFRFALIASFSTDLAGLEQNVVYSIQMFLHNGNLYASPALPPFSITQYTPLYYLLCGWVARLFHLDPSADIHRLYMIGRSLDLLFNFVTAFFIYRTARRIFRITAQSAVILFFISFIFSFTHNFAVRPDSLQDALSVSSIYFFLLYQESDKSMRNLFGFLFPAVLLSALSVFSKQSGIQLIFLFGGFSVLIMDWRSIGRILLLSVVVYGGFWMLVTHEYLYFAANTIGGIANGLSLENFIKYVIGKPLFLVSILPLILISAYRILRKNEIFKGPLTSRFLAVAVIGTFLFATVTALKMGSTVQYYVLFLNMALLFIFKTFFGQPPAEASRPDGPASRNAICIFFYCCLTMLIYTAYDFKQNYIFNHEPRQAELRAGAEDMAVFIRGQLAASEDKYVFANLPTDYKGYSRHGINNILFASCLFPQLEILEFSAGPLKIIGYERFEQDLQNGKIEFIIESSPAYGFAVSKNLEALKKDHYRLWREMNGYRIYKFNQ